MSCKTLFALLLLVSGAAFGQVVSQQPYFNVVTLEASATADVPTDTLTITLFTEEQGPDPADLSAKVNQRLEQALARAKPETAVQTRSGSYQTNPLYDRANQITGWRIRAELTLESRDFKAAAALAGKLQPGLKLSSMAFSLSRAAREKAEAALLTDALQKYQEKAGSIAKTLGFPGFTLGQINVRADGPIFRPVAYKGVAMAAMADGMAGAPPVPVEGGNNAVTVTVSGSVVLGPGK
jgi:predicted secreted protein